MANMAKTQLGKRLTTKQIEQISTFFNALTGNKPKVIYPLLPTETKKTPKPSLN